MISPGYSITSLFRFCITAGLVILLFPACRKSLLLQNPDKSPSAVFREAWTILDQKYALFPVKDVNWSQVYEQYLPPSANGISENDLFNIISNMTGTLKDGHISLISSSHTYTYDNFYTGYAINFNYNNLINNYLNNNYYKAGPVIYTVKNNVGYIYYSSFDMNITDQYLDSLFSFMKNTKGLIVDVRSNTGGATKNVQLLFQRFLSGRKLVKYEIRKNGPAHNDYASPEAQFIDGSGNPYLQPVCLLTNRSCFSACNDFAMFMSQLPNVTLVGDQTGGGGGIPVQYILANGWILQYTATMTVSPEQQSNEKGILPNVPIGINNLDEQYGKDPILEKAFSILH